MSQSSQHQHRERHKHLLSPPAQQQAAGRALPLFGNIQTISQDGISEKADFIRNCNAGPPADVRNQTP